MSRKANTVVVGAFVIFAILLAFILVILFSGNQWWKPRDRYVLLYDTSIHGLNVGAPVALKGVRIGQVSDIHTSLNEADMQVLNTVVIEIEEDALLFGGKDGHKPTAQQLINNGIRAQLRQQSILTGLLYVYLDFEPDKPGHLIEIATAYPQLPSSPTDLQQLSRELENIDLNLLLSDLQQTVSGANKLLNNPELHQVASQLNLTLTTVNNSLQNVETQIATLVTSYTALADNTNQAVNNTADQIAPVLVKLDKTIDALNNSAQQLHEFSANADFLTSDDSPLLHSVITASESIDRAANRLGNLSTMLEQDPQSLFLGRASEE